MAVPVQMLALISSTFLAPAGFFNALHMFMSNVDILYLF